MDCSRPLLTGSVLLPFVLLLVGCGGGEGPDYGNWTLETDGLSLTEDLRVSETETFYFGGIGDIAVRDDGWMAVADYEANDVKVLRPDGSLAHTLGQRGEGPGEFQRVGSLQWARSDSLFAFDPGASRLTVFAPSPPHPGVRTVSFSREEGRPSGLHVGAETLLAEYIHLLPPDEDRPRYREVRFVDANGIPGDTLFRARRRPIKNVSTGEVIQFRPVPFGRGTEIAWGPDGRLYSGFQDSLRIVAHSPNGSAQSVARVPAPAVPISGVERDSALASIDNDDMRRAVAAEMPATKPAFTDMVVADDGTLWIERPVEGPGAETVVWWRLDPDTKTIRTIRFPRGVDIEVVQNGHVYGATSTDVGAPALVRYRIES